MGQWVIWARVYVFMIHIVKTILKDSFCEVAKQLNGAKLSLIFLSNMRDQSDYLAQKCPEKF